MTYTIDNLRSAAGVVAILGVAWLFAERKTWPPLRLIIGALGLQAAFALLVFAVPVVRANLGGLNAAVDALAAASKQGSAFVFGHVGGGAAPFAVVNPLAMTSLAFQVFPLVIVVSALSALLWRWGVLEAACKALGFLFQKTLGLSGALSLATAANIFLGMVEAPLVIRPHLERMTRSEMFVVMTTGLATVAGTVMAIYASLLRPTLPDATAHILVASFMAAPASVLIARIMLPESEAASTAATETRMMTYRSSMEAFTTGVEEGVRMMINIIAMLLAAVALVALANMIIAAVVPPVWGAPLSIERVFGWVFAPAMWLIGIPWSEAGRAGELMGVKTVLNEFLAYVQLAGTPAAEISGRTRTILTYALCGFANFSAVGIMIGGLSAICPSRRDDIIQLGTRSIVSGTLTTWMTAALIGALPESLFSV